MVEDVGFRVMAAGTTGLSNIAGFAGDTSRRWGDSSQAYAVPRGRSYEVGTRRIDSTKVKRRIKGYGGATEEERLTKAVDDVDEAERLIWRRTRSSGRTAGG